MGRSHVHHPKLSWVCYSSNKKDKRLANRRFRRVNKHILTQDILEEKMLFKKIREVSDTYDFNSDGLPHYLSMDDLERLKENMGDLYYRMFMR